MPSFSTFRAPRYYTHVIQHEHLDEYPSCSYHNLNLLSYIFPYEFVTNMWLLLLLFLSSYFLFLLGSPSDVSVHRDVEYRRRLVWLTPRTTPRLANVFSKTPAIISGRWAEHLSASKQLSLDSKIYPVHRIGVTPEPRAYHIHKELLLRAQAHI